MTLYQGSVEYVSRIPGEENCDRPREVSTIELDFKNIDTVGQAFADEIFRIWQARHQDVKIIPGNADENVLFMINRAKA